MSYNKLREHVGHFIECVGYALKDLRTGERLSDFQSVSIECITCNQVLVDFEKPVKKSKIINKK